MFISNPRRQFDFKFHAFSILITPQMHRILSRKTASKKNRLALLKAVEKYYLRSNSIFETGIRTLVIEKSLNKVCLLFLAEINFVSRLI